MMSMMTGDAQDQQGFNNNFNMMLPLAMRDCNDSACEEKKRNIMMVMVAMQSNAPQTSFGPDMIRDVNFYKKLVAFALRLRASK
ncbi:unnamed protein product [Oikopleura dioica]|uniref:Uncharacterized protein n=1 Tax=Oikopleura dioica TaxID=34765 RepID=E4X1S7_OIKDI|nr:unnamed protein product [Oikopleura dioica]